jgi:tellurite resistance protein
MLQNNCIKYLPISLFAMIMGLSGLSLAWAKTATVYKLPSIIGESLIIITAILFALLLVIYVLKMLFNREALVTEWRNPIKINFIPTIPISFLLLATGFMEVSTTMSEILWLTGATLQLITLLFVINSWLHQEKYEIHHMNPAWFIPAVGNVIVPLAGVALGYGDISWFFFSIGIIFWLLLFVIVFYRIVFHQPLPEKLLPTLFIILAPPAVGFIAYYRLTGSVDFFAMVLFNFALFLSLLLATQVPRLIKLPFFISWWAYTFPLAAMSIASQLMAEISSKQIYSAFGLVMLAILTLLIVYILYKTLVAGLRGKICSPDV